VVNTKTTFVGCFADVVIHYVKRLVNDYDTYLGHLLLNTKTTLMSRTLFTFYMRLDDIIPTYNSVVHRLRE
jgi:hypothetical protein